MLWLLLALGVAVPAGVALAILAGGRAHAAVFPYYTTFACKVIGAAGVVDRRLGLGWLPSAGVDTYATLARHRVRNFRRIARAFRALDALPTVQRGLRTVGLRSALDAQIRRDRLTRLGVTPPLQKPYFFLPGVPAQTFYEAADFEWAAELERAFPIVREELLSVLADDQPRTFRTCSGEFGHVTPGWQSLNFFLLGERVEASGGARFQPDPRHRVPCRAGVRGIPPHGAGAPHRQDRARLHGPAGPDDSAG